MENKEVRIAAIAKFPAKYQVLFLDIEGLYDICEKYIKQKKYDLALIAIDLALKKIKEVESTLGSE